MLYALSEELKNSALTLHAYHNPEDVPDPLEAAQQDEIDALLFTVGPDPTPAATTKFPNAQKELDRKNRKAGFEKWGINDEGFFYIIRHWADEDLGGKKGAEGTEGAEGKEETDGTDGMDGKLSPTETERIDNAATEDPDDEAGPHKVVSATFTEQSGHEERTEILERETSFGTDVSGSATQIKGELKAEPKPAGVKGTSTDSPKSRVFSSDDAKQLAKGSAAALRDAQSVVG